MVYSEDYKKLVDATALKDKYYEIDERVEEICKEAFKGCDKLEEIVMPKKLKKIDSEAFQGCSSLTKLTLPDSVMSIGKGAFCGCSGLTELTLPNSVRLIEVFAFEGCSGLTKLTLPDSITSIGDCAFYGCSGLTELTLPNSVKSIGESAFAYCSGLTELTLSNSVTSIGYSAFRGCSGLTELTLPNSVTSIGDCAFADCSGLEKIMVESGNSRYDSRDNCNSIIDTETNTLIAGCKNSVIPNGVTSIGDSAFGWCSELTELVLPNSVTSIVESAFAYCSGLEKITVESGNSRYDSRDNCNSIIETETNTLIIGCKNSIIPNSVTSIGNCAFSYCSGLVKITSLAEIPPVCDSEVFDGVNKTNCELIVPEGAVAAYTRAEDWNEFSNIRAFPE